LEIREIKKEKNEGALSDTTSLLGKLIEGVPFDHALALQGRGVSMHALSVSRHALLASMATLDPERIVLLPYLRK